MKKQKVFIPVESDDYNFIITDVKRKITATSDDKGIFTPVKEQEGYFFTPEETNKIFGLQEAWPLVDVLKKLTEASDILLKQKNYDGHGWEEIHHATGKAKEYIESLNIK